MVGNKFINLILIITFSYILNSCDSPCNTPLSVVAFDIYLSDSNHDDIFSQSYLGSFPLDSIMLYYVKDGKIFKDSVSYIKMPSAGINVYSVGSSDILDQSLSGIKTFYFRRGFNVIDTIYFDEQRVTEWPNCHIYKLYSFKYNGVNIPADNEKVVVKH